ncbi:MFS transporter [Streptomyces sp. NPDC058067]|uniref:MFS transporter n=1 Tax=Streptomyces sp. NPDC058067 TaxID=3346324 RepID=UPI0036E753BD
MITHGASDSGEIAPQRGVFSGPFRLFWFASAISSIGDGITRVALPVLAIVELHASDFEVSLISTVSYGGVLVIGLPAGLLAQRFDLRRLQLTLDAVRAAVVLTVPAGAMVGVLSMAQVLVVALVVSLATTLFDVANAAFIPTVVAPEKLLAGNNALSGIAATSAFLGPALGGVVVHSFGPANSMFADSLSYVASFMLLAGIAQNLSGTAAPEIQSGGQIRLSLRYIARHSIIRANVLASSLVNFANGALIAVIPTFLVRTLGLPPGALGLVLAMQGLGAVLAALLLARVVRWAGDAPVLLWSVTATAFFAALLPMTVSSAAMPLFLIALAGAAAGVTALSVITRTHRQLVTPPLLLAPVIAAVRFITWAMLPLGSLASGIAAQAATPRAGLIVTASVACFAAVALWRSPVSSIRRLADATETP